jgi:hypothetical protein
MSSRCIAAASAVVDADDLEQPEKEQAMVSLSPVMTRPTLRWMAAQASARCQLLAGQSGKMVTHVVIGTHPAAPCECSIVLTGHHLTQ